MNSVGKKPKFIKDVFLDQTEANKAGIYTVRLYIRGKPWLLNVDDRIMFSDEEDGPWYSRPDPTYKSYWGLILEKAWGKAFGNYASLKVGGFAT